MKSVNNDITYWVKFFEDLLDMGINHLHVSKDYESYSLLCNILSEINKNNLKKKFKFTVKLPEPDFDNHIFESKKFIKKVDQYLNDLKVDKIHNIQWMWRSDLQEDKKRIQLFNNSLINIVDTVKICKANNKINNFYCFPYTLDFVNFNTKIFDGFIIYYNPAEIEFEKFMKRVSYEKKIITIRPFLGGDLPNKKKIALPTLLDFQFKHEFINGIVYTCTKKSHISELRKYLRD